MKGEFDTTDRLENENLECCQCGKHFKLKRYLDQHISKIHDTKTHPFECTECGSQFKQKCHLKRHKINKHKIFISYSFCYLASEYWNFLSNLLYVTGTNPGGL